MLAPFLGRQDLHADVATDCVNIARATGANGFLAIHNLTQLVVPALQDASVAATLGTAAASASTKTDPRMNGQCVKGQPKCTMCLALMPMTTMVKMI